MPSPPVSPASYSQRDDDILVNQAQEGYEKNKRKVNITQYAIIVVH